MLKLEKVTVQAGSFTLKPLDLEIPRGECHALLGPSGAGKSTVLELIVGFRKPQSGRIFLDGRDATPVPAERRNIGYLPQSLALFPHLTVRENILYGIRRRRKPTPDDRGMLSSLADALGLTPLLERKPAHLSGGERQRAALARALAPAPELLILDEPFSALNEALRRDLWGLLKDLQTKFRIATLMVTHDLEEAFFFGERVHILIDGRLHQSGPRRPVFDRPATFEAARLLGVRNLFPARFVGITGGIATIECDSLGIRFAVRNDADERMELHIGDAVTVGIRPEFLTIGDNRGTRPEESVRFPARVIELTETIRGVQATIRPKGRATPVTVSLGFHETSSIRKNDEIEVCLPTKHLFLVPQENASGFGEKNGAEPFGR